MLLKALSLPENFWKVIFLSIFQPLFYDAKLDDWIRKF